MKTYKYILILLLATMPSIVVHAQIGYQVSLLNSATGQPRAGETVTVDIKLTNCENNEVYTTQQKATSNDFGVLSLSVGDAETFEELDWNKLPLYIEVSIDGVLIAKSQVLSVPVAEYAKKSGFVLTKEFLASRTWKHEGRYHDVTTLSFSRDGAYNLEESYDGELRIESGKFYICGDNVILRRNSETTNAYYTYYVDGFYLSEEDILIIDQEGFR